VPAARIQHILGVETLAIALATHHHLNPAQAAQAGLMHDLAKYFSPQKLLDLATAEGIALDPIDRANPHILHAEVGAIVARHEFGITDTEILQAIADHTLGQPNMSPLSCVIFLADKLEAGRGDTAELNQLRQISYQNLQQAVWMLCDSTIQYLLAHRQLIHPRAIATRNGFLQRTHFSSKPL
jgi:predicted HD superfamily hydrolase involved in NAD metabolism